MLDDDAAMLPDDLLPLRLFLIVAAFRHYAAAAADADADDIIVLRRRSFISICCLTLRYRFISHHAAFCPKIFRLPCRR